jgi:hypothetical protein
MEVKLSSASTISEADLATAVPETNRRLNKMVKMQMYRKVLSQRTNIGRKITTEMKKEKTENVEVTSFGGYGTGT